jgi:phosphatidylglycerophosphatase A
MIRRLGMTAFGLGLAPIASGTFGSAGAIVVAAGAIALQRAAGLPVILLDAAWLVLMLLACWGCVAWGPWAVEHYGARSRKKGDPSAVVLDECAGQWLALLVLPMSGGWMHVAAVLTMQFFFFRLFDVIKPPPARQLEKLPAGWGILFDDLAAAVYANLVGQLVFRVLLQGWLT